MKQSELNADEDGLVVKREFGYGVRSKPRPINPAIARRYFTYDPVTGGLNCRPGGPLVNGVNCYFRTENVNGCIVVHLYGVPSLDSAVNGDVGDEGVRVARGEQYLAHRIVAAMITGQDPGTYSIAHRDKVRTNNRADNLLWNSKTPLCEFESFKSMMIDAVESQTVKPVRVSVVNEDSVGEKAEFVLKCCDRVGFFEYPNPGQYGLLIRRTNTFYPIIGLEPEMDFTKGPWMINGILPLYKKGAIDEIEVIQCDELLTFLSSHPFSIKRRAQRFRLPEIGCLADAS